MFERTSIIALVFICACGLPERLSSPAVDEPAHNERPFTEALWVFTDEITSEQRRNRLIEEALRSGYNTFYLSVYQPSDNRDDWRMYDASDVAALLAAAREAGIEVWAAYGNPDWIELGTAEGSFPRRRFKEIAAYNRRYPGASFRGIILDIEPVEPAHLRGLLRFYAAAIDALSDEGLEAAVAIQHYWNEPVALPSGQTRPVHDQIIDMAFDHVVVMGYRNFAGTSCDDNGLICVHEDELRYADVRDRRSFLLVGLRTTSVEADGGEPITTFHGMPEEWLHREKRLVASYFADNKAFAGFATHRYEPPVFQMAEGKVGTGPPAVGVADLRR